MGVNTSVYLEGCTMRERGQSLFYRDSGQSGAREAEKE